MSDERKPDASSPVSSDRVRGRLWLLVGSGLLLGGALSVATPSVGGCIYHDTCIKVTSPGHDWCRNLANALQWPAGGSIEDAIPVIDASGAAPQGCRCFNDAERQVLDDKTPACKLDELLDEIENAVRQECQSLVLPGHTHNCWQAGGPNASTVEGAFEQSEPGSCIGNCEFGGPPSGGSCPEPNPYECATGDDGGLCGAGDEPSSADSTGSDESETDDTSAGMDVLDAHMFISCEGMDCEIEESFALTLYYDPTPLLGESTRLIYDRKAQRHVLVDVRPGSLAHTLGLRTHDRLESINGTIIDSLSAGLDVYADSGTKSEFEVQIARGDQWLTFNYSIVP